VDIDTNRLFRTEVETMSQYVHENLLALLAFSADGPDCCLVYSFIPNGSLEARLACEVSAVLLMVNHITCILIKIMHYREEVHRYSGIKD
jgi:interleukin-1 receptor-associated kinase 4